MPTMSINLSDALAQFVEQEMARGGYSSQSEVVGDALRLLHRERVRRAVGVGIDDWRHGRVDDRSIDDILDEIDRDEP